MIEEFDTFSITNTGRIGLLLSCVEKIKNKFSQRQDIVLLIESLLDDSWLWMENRHPTCSDIYHTYNPKLIEFELDFHNDPRLLIAFHAILYMHYYTLEKMYVIEYFETGIEPIVGSDVFEVDEGYFFNCLNNCIKVLEKYENVESWIEYEIQKLQQQYAPKNKNDLGEPISKTFFSLKI
jgi:hypothetical protein